MTARRAHFDVIRTNAGWHAVFVAGNNEPVFSTEVYTRRASALKAIHSLLNACEGTNAVTVRVVDERVKP